jgi:hypothetical protein
MTERRARAIAARARRSRMPLRLCGFSRQRQASQPHHVTVDGLPEWIAWWDAQEASA